MRGVLPPILGLFDFASPERTVALRDESTVPAQALFLLNNPWMEWQARAAARRLLADSRFPNDESRIDAAYRVALGRPPRSSERALAVEFVAATFAATNLAATESAATNLAATESGAAPSAVPGANGAANPQGGGNKAARPMVSLAELTEDRWTGFCQALMASAEFRVVP